MESRGRREEEEGRGEGKVESRVKMNCSRIRGVLKRKRKVIWGYFEDILLQLSSTEMMTPRRGEEGKNQKRRKEKKGERLYLFVDELFL